MTLTKENNKWCLKDMGRIIGTAYPHGGWWRVNGEDETGMPFTTWARTEDRAVFLLKKYTGYK